MVRSWLSIALWIVVAAVIAFLVVPVAAQQGQEQQGQIVHRPADKVGSNRTPIVCPETKETGDVSFDRFYEDFSQCRIMPIRHWWQAWKFWDRGRPAIRTRKIPKGSISSVLFSTHMARMVVQ